MASWSLPDALTLLHQQYPGAFVTSGQRDLNSALGRANPRSYHNVGEAFDIRPMPGVDFNSYVSSLKSAGLPVVEALNEAKNPKPWTTGPNWHIAFSGDKKVATSPIDLVKRAQAFNVDIPADSMPQAGGPMSAAPGFDLQKALASIKLADAPPAQSRRGAIWANILGALSDGLLTMGGQQPIYAPLAERQRETTADSNLSQQKLQADIEAKKLELLAKLSEPPQFVQNLQAWQSLDPATKQQYLQYQDATNPITVATPQGTQAVPRTASKIINGKTYYRIGDQWFEEGN